jgi:hypothetical protein
MASWSLSLGPISKAAMASALASATPSQATGYDPGSPLNASESVLVSHFNAAIASAQAAVASLVGLAPRVQVTLQGYRDTVTSAPFAGAASSKTKVTAVEVW